MADAIIQVVAGKLIDALKEHSGRVLEFRSQFMELKTQLDFMKSFLADANKLKRKEETVKTTLSMIRELTYDAEDILTDCLLRAEFRDHVFRCNHFLPREMIFQHRTSKRLKDINGRIEKMHKVLKTYLKTIGQQGVHDDVSSVIHRRWTSPAFDESSIVGLAEDTMKIIGWILPTKKQLHQVGIIGMGGLGKTTITQKIFNNHAILERFEERIWVSISQTVNEEETMKTMLKQLGEDTYGLDMGQMLPKIKQALEGKDYLIVMDDVWSVHGWWERLLAGLPKREGQSSAVIITTRKESVAIEMGVEKARIHQPRVLNEEESWALFCRIAFSSEKEAKQHYELEELGKDIVKKCCGLPLAIKTVGGLLKSKTLSTDVWRRIHNNFHDELATREGESSVMASLQLSYDELPTRLKQCLLCFSIYPEDSVISAEQLVHWWVGEGFVQGKDSRTAIELAFDYLSELISRCLVEVVKQRGFDGRVYTCKMHDLVRDLTIKIAREESFCSFDEHGKQRPSIQSRRLGFTGEEDVKSLNKKSKLRAFLMMNSSPVSPDKTIPLFRVRSLRVLDFSLNKLENIPIPKLLHWIISLQRLSYLNLRGVASLKELPQLIGDLRNLQLLVLNGCNNLQKLPSSITNLQKLNVLDLGYCPMMRYLPQGLGRLSNLQELSGFTVPSEADRNGCRLGELQWLSKLKVLRVNINEESDIAEEELTVLSHLKQLKVLSINTEGCEKEEIFRKLDGLSPPPHLEELYLRYYRGVTTPMWMNPKSLRDLHYLCIENGDLQFVHPSFEGGKTITWKVEGLCLKFLARLQVVWDLVMSVMPRIRYVEVSHCYMLKSFPCNTEKLGVWRK
ncbi:hypothetical protein ERO13_A01G072000v2 [Gossypium hirsutum]|uniref:Disease resistance RPP13-like protein 4 n=3 Tax=Gossypium TaxID=3633 RepID=A0A1U8KFR4_GOSHI|nr:disease resistance RPP13-like protein 4 [Gossypium hirsutum]XP_040931865.1 disease resistance RPP13-like protein 4 [Gossypium hirsutum]XP_040931866.1 disease resistance RPP13-like protein 4 [Gossypium hirsutum]KAB2095907.1 hypothetical protein ES319_A01G072900v1 [Gossypium barbadense]TYI42263.1 hypothetical protein ES332_A01G086200v1 [Gossypium tomentosum]KAB2095908.1 hypothetical protein ES319_A01G072900v1 [Gossypium barbadense]KAG4213692.1 hypothetical protein ERO13_A01G072000v2 [Gossypi